MKNLQRSKLTAYSAMALCTLACGEILAQVIYTDIDPDFEFNDYDDINNYVIDFNDDGALDLNLQNFRSSYDYFDSSGGWRSSSQNVHVQVYRVLNNLSAAEPYGV